MSEEQTLAQPVADQPLQQSQKRLTLLNSVIILAIIYLVCEIVPLYMNLIDPAIIPWVELGQWLLIAIWLFVGVRPPFMRWLKQARQQ